MELWVRSQNKKVLMKVSTLEMLEDDNSVYTTYLDKVIRLGKYKTKERALEVLDEIQSILNLKDMYKYDREIVLKSWENVDTEQVKTIREQMSVYEMPKD